MLRFCVYLLFLFYLLFYSFYYFALVHVYIYFSLFNIIYIDIEFLNLNLELNEKRLFGFHTFYLNCNVSFS